MCECLLEISRASARTVELQVQIIGHAALGGIAGHAFAVLAAYSEPVHGNSPNASPMRGRAHRPSADGECLRTKAVALGEVRAFSATCVGERVRFGTSAKCSKPNVPPNPETNLGGFEV